MRLTLRTMLAYMDDILEPEDAQVLEQKINESEFATTLMHRIRAATQKIRLGAPKLDGKGIGLDPNTVAAYLDNGLTQDRIPEFEKICLESEVHLAEVASCHQILALVLGERVDVPPELRDKMCRIVDQSSGKAAPVHGESAAPATAAAVAATAGTASETEANGADATAPSPRKRELEVPDYLRTKSQIQFRSLALTVAVAFLVVLVSLRALGPFDSSHPLLGWLSAPDPVAANDPDADLENGPDVDPNAAPDATPAADADTDPTAASDGDADVDAGGPERGGDETPAKASDEDPVDDDTPPEPGTDVAAADTAEPPSSAKASDADANLPEVPAEASPPAAPVASSPDVAEPAAEPAAPPMEIGRFMTGDQVVGRFDPANQSWYRMGPRASVRSGEQLLVLPTYRPQFALTSDIQMMVAGPAHLRFRPPLEQQVPSVELSYGRAMVDTIGPTGARIALQLAGREGLGILTDSEAALAAEVGLFLPPGADPEASTADRIVWIRAISGQVLWQEGDEPPTKLNAGQALVLFNDQPGTIQDMPEMPGWIQSASLRDIDLRASRELEPLLDVQRSLSLSLEEVVEEHRQVEIRALATRSLSYLESFAPFVTALNDEWQYSYWKEHFDALRTALARGPASADAIRVAFEKHRPEHAGLLYRLVWGYSPEQLAEGADAELVALLEHPKMDVRALAFENLRRITGKTHHYRPEKSLDQQRRRWILDWQKDLADKAITYEAPAPAPRPAPAANGN